MMTPYDWQEGIGNRAQYIEGKLSQGAPVIAVSAADGILMVTYRRQSRKLFEVYDRMAFAGVGQQSDVEAIRIAAVDFASKEGYQRSEQDVTVARVATAISQPIKRAFADFSSSPFVVRCVFAEVGATPESDLYYVIDYTGDYTVSRKSALVVGDEAVGERILKEVSGLDLSLQSNELVDKLQQIWLEAMTPEGGTSDEVTEGLQLEALLIERVDTREDRFRHLTPLDI